MKSFTSFSAVSLLLALVLIIQSVESAKPTFHSYADPQAKKTCLLVAAKAGITVTTVNKDTKTETPKSSEFNIKNVAVNCEKGVAKKLTLPKTSDIELSFNFNESPSKWTMQPEAKIGSVEYIAKDQDISVSKSFSFSCQKYKIKLVPKEKSGKSCSHSCSLDKF